MKKKLFISHASEDKETFVRKLAEALTINFDVWYDEYQLVVGTSLFEEISKGLSTCDYGVVVLSKSFFAKKWPQNELNGLFTLEEKDKKVILPVWHNVEYDEVKLYSPILADRFAAKSEDGIDSVIKEIKGSVEYFERGKSIQCSMPGLTKLRSSLQRKAEVDRSESIVLSNAGVAIATELGQATFELLVSHIKTLQEEGIIKIQLDGPKGSNVRRLVNVTIDKLCLSAEYVNTVINSARDARLYMTLKKATLGSWNDTAKYTNIERKGYTLFIAENNDRFWKAENERETFTPDDIVNNWLAKLSDRLEK